MALTILGSGFLFPLYEGTGSPPVEESKALAAGKALAENGAYEEAIAYLSVSLSNSEMGSSERARIFHMLGFLFLYAGHK
jgi:hypothetical protein